MTQAITLNLPDNIYQRIQRMAQATQRPVKEFLLDTVATALPLLDDLPQSWPTIWIRHRRRLGINCRHDTPAALVTCATLTNAPM